jgi:hypothetical protein
MAYMAQAAQSPDLSGPSESPVARRPGAKTPFLAWASRPRHALVSPSATPADRWILP